MTMVLSISNGNALKLLHEKFGKGEIPTGISNATFFHDDWCEILTDPRRGVCNCDPDIVILPGGGE